MNITMIGMPSSGKSLIGVLLAKRLGMQFLDLDLEIQDRTGKLLRELIAERGIDAFLALEEEVALSIRPAHRTVIAPGGSVCYEDRAMKYLGSISTVVYLKISYEEMARRIGNPKRRGVALKEGFTLKDLYLERARLYEKYADLTVDENGMRVEAIVSLLEEHFRGRK